MIKRIALCYVFSLTLFVINTGLQAQEVVVNKAPYKYKHEARINNEDYPSYRKAISSGEHKIRPARQLLVSSRYLNRQLPYKVEIFSANRQPVRLLLRPVQQPLLYFYL